MTSNTLQKTDNHQAKVEVSEQDTFTLTQPNGEQATYDLKSLRNQPSFDEKNNVELYMSDVSNKLSMDNPHAISINKETGEYQYGQLIGKEKIDEFFSMVERLGIEQRDKMHFRTPSQDWLELADKMTDEQLNSLVDIAFDISKSLFLESKNNEEVDNIIQKLNTLDADDLDSAINTMLYLTEQAKSAEYGDSEAYVGFTVDFSSHFRLVHKEGEVLRDYMEFISAPELKEKDIAIVNEHLVNMDYTQASGLMESARLMEGDSKKQLFDLLNDNETDEISEIFAYIGALSTKPSNVQQYQIDFGNGKNELSTVFDPKFDDDDLTSLIENVLSVNNKTDLNRVIEYIDKSSTAIDQAQVAIWQAIAKSTDESPSELKSQYFDSLIGSITADITERHEKEIRSVHHVGFEFYGNEKSKVTAFNREHKINSAMTLNSGA